MNIPSFTLDLGGVLMLLSTSMIGFIWKHLINQIKQGDDYLEERIIRMEQQHDKHQTSAADLKDHLQKIELQLTALNTRIDLLTSQPPRKGRPQ